MVARRRTESKVKVLVLHNTTGGGPDRLAAATPEGAAIAVESEADLAHLRGLADGLGEGGFDVALVDAEDDTQRITHAVVVEKPALVFLVDHFHGDALRHPNVASLLELHGLTYTGSDPLCLSTCRDRVRTYLLLSDAGIPVPEHAVVRDINAIPDTDSLGGPLLVSHALDDLVDQPNLRALARARADVEERAHSLAATVGLPLLVERLIEGRRIQAVVLGNRVLEVLPLVERATGASGQLGPAQIAQLDVDTADSIRALAQRAFRVMGCRDCAQVDFAQGGDGGPYVINVRPLFDMFPHGAFVVGAGASELGFAGAVAHLADIALERAEPEPALEPEPDPQPALALAEEAAPPAPEPESEPPPAEPVTPPAADRPKRPRPPTPRRRPASRDRPRTGSPAPPPAPKKKPPARPARKPAAKKTQKPQKKTKKK